MRPKSFNEGLLERKLKGRKYVLIPWEDVELALMKGPAEPPKLESPKGPIKEGALLVGKLGMDELPARYETVRIRGNIV